MTYRPKTSLHGSDSIMLMNKDRENRTLLFSRKHSNAHTLNSQTHSHMQLSLTSISVLDIAGLYSGLDNIVMLTKRGLLVKLVKKPFGNMSTLSSYAGNQHAKHNTCW